MKSTLIRYSNISFLCCLTLLGLSLIATQANAQSYTYRNTNNVIKNPAPTYDLGGNIISGDSFTFINYYPTDGTFTANSFFYCTADTNSYNGDKYASSINFIDTVLDGSAYLYVNSNCVTFLSETNTYTGGTCVDGASLNIVNKGTLGSKKGYTTLTNNAILDLGGTTQSQQSFNYLPYDPNTATNGCMIRNGTIVDGTGKSTTFDGNGNIATAPETNGPVAPPMPPTGN